MTGILNTTSLSRAAAAALSALLLSGCAALSGGGSEAIPADAMKRPVDLSVVCVLVNEVKRTFPLYLEDDTNANPTGGICEIQYKLVDGEACRILKPVKYTIYNIVDEKVMK